MKEDRKKIQLKYFEVGNNLHLQSNRYPKAVSPVLNVIIFFCPTIFFKKHAQCLLKKKHFLLFMFISYFL